MIKATADHKDGHITIETDFVDLKTLTAEVCGIINQFYSLLMENDAGAAAAFRAMMRAAVNDADSPVWEVDDMTGAMAECISVQKPKKNPD